MSKEAPICEICKQTKSPMVERTEQTHEPIYVCTATVGKQKMPCDGFAFEIASRRV